jgi:hypothetical protein
MMADCFHCGAEIGRGQGVRREVYTGHSSGSSFSYGSGNYYRSRRSNYAIHTLCRDCAEKNDQGKAMRAVVGVGVVLAVLAAGSVSQHKSSSPAEAAPASGSVLVIPSVHPEHRTHHNRHSSEDRPGGSTGVGDGVDSAR